MRSKMLLVILAVLTCVVLSSVTFAAEKPAAKAEFDQEAVLMEIWKAPDNTVVGTVDGKPITKYELMKTMWFWNAPTVLQEVLNQKMINDAAGKANVELTWSELQGKVQESLKRMGMDSVKQLLNQFRITNTRFLSGTKVSALAEKTVQKDIQVTDAEYAEWIKARHILVMFPTDETDQAKKEEAAKAKIDEIAAKVKAGEDFAKLADEFSQDPGNNMNNVKQGGDLGWFSRGRMVQEFENAAFELKAGEVSEPVKTTYGYHIIKLEKLGKDATPAEKAELKAQILERKTPMIMGQWFAELQAKTKIVNKLMPPPAVEQPQPQVSVKPAPAPAPAPKAEAKPAAKPAAPAASAKPATPPAPPAN